MTLILSLISDEFVVHRFDPKAPIPPQVLVESLVFIARTDEELSIVCSIDVALCSNRSEADWRCLKVEGKLDFNQTGILAELSAVLAGANISVFTVSTFDTDYLLVKADKIESACAALRRAGNTIRSG